LAGVRAAAIPAPQSRPSEMLVTTNTSIFTFDFDRRAMLTQTNVDIGDSVHCMTVSSRGIYCGTQSGHVMVRDPRTPIIASSTSRAPLETKRASSGGSGNLSNLVTESPLPRYIAHAGPVCSIDVKGDLLVTCGDSGKPGYVFTFVITIFV
jgi:hypothetical protein